VHCSREKALNKTSKKKNTTVDVLSINLVKAKIFFYEDARINVYIEA
jgi:hypothetical protein